jgi:hypothetical protein
MMMSELIERLEAEQDTLKRHAPKVWVEVDRQNCLKLFTDCKEALQQSQWVSVEDLPELGEPVILTNVNEWENTGGDLVRNVQDCGYLSEFGAKYWSIRGQGARSLDAYTHYQLVTQPAKEQGS